MYDPNKRNPNKEDYTLVYFNEEKDAVVKELGSDMTLGLTAEEASNRLSEYGPNKFKGKEKEDQPSEVFRPV